MGGIRAKKGKKNRKLGNNKVYCTRYKNEGRQEINKIRRMKRHLRKFPNDLAVKQALGIK